MGGDAALEPSHLALLRARAAIAALPPIQLRLSSLRSLSLRILPPQGGKGKLLALWLALAVALCSFASGPAFAHTSERAFILLLPTGYYLLGGGLAVAASFLILLAVPADRLRRWSEARHPTDGELKGTTILAVSLAEASAKIRTGGPKDNDDDLHLPVWAGVIPLALTTGAPVADNDEALPLYAERYRRV